MDLVASTYVEQANEVRLLRLDLRRKWCVIDGYGFQDGSPIEVYLTYLNDESYVVKLEGYDAAEWSIFAAETSKYTLSVALTRRVQ